EEAKEKELVDDLYDQFLEAVAEGREMTMDQVRALATGEVYTGRRAHELKLVDEVGDLDTAIDLAVELSGAPRKPVWTHPRRGLREALSSMMGASMGAEIASQLEERFSPQYLLRHR